MTDKGWYAIKPKQINKQTNKPTSLFIYKYIYKFIYRDIARKSKGANNGNQDCTRNKDLFYNKTSFLVQ